MTSTCIAGFSLETWHENSFKTQCLKAESGDVVGVVEQWFAKCLTLAPCPKARAWANNWKKSCFAMWTFHFTSIFLRMVGLWKEDFWPALVAACQVHLGKAMPKLMPFKATTEAMAKMDCEVWEPPVKFGKNHNDSFQTFLHFSLLRKAPWVQHVQPSALNGCVDYSQGWQIMQQITA